VQKRRALRIIVMFAIIGFAAAWLYSRWRGETVSNDPAATAWNGDLTDEDLALDAYDSALPELVVDFKDDEPHDQIAKLGDQLGVHFKPASAQFDVDEIYTVDTANAASVLAALRANPDVEAAELNFSYGIPEDSLPFADEEGISAGNVDVNEKGFPNDPKFKYQWHLDQVNSKGAWKGAQGEGVIVAVVDTGVAKVPDLANTELVAGYDFVADRADATDDHGHGTHVAGTIAQSTHNGVGVAGLAFKAKIMPIKVLSARGSGSVSGIAEGIRFAADHGAKVINMSLGGPMSSSVLAKAVKYAHDKGVTVVCAAGNDGRGKVSYPAAYPHAIAVAATQFDETTTFYSNWGKEIDIAAPGGNTRVDQNGDGMMDGVLQNTVVPGDTKRNDYLLFMGTSMASPHVAGIAALVISSGVTDPDAVEKVLKETARKPKGKSEWQKGDENRYGAGIIDAAAAVKKAHAKTGGWELGVAVAGMALVLMRLRRAGKLSAGLGVGGFVTMVAASGGLFFLNLLGVPGAHFVANGLPAVDMVFGANAHGNPLFYSALIPVLATLILYSKKGLRGVLAGLSIGVGAHLLVHGLFRTIDIHWVPNMLDSAWLYLNAGICFITGYATLRK
jgi:serine protease